MRLQLVYPSLSGLLLLIVFLIDLPKTAIAQEPFFELPVQLVGFPVIIVAVRLANFVKKLSYSLNPQTYQSRSRRQISHENTSSEFSHQSIDISLAEKKIIEELGPKACVIEEPCRLHATRKEKSGAEPDWNNILRGYKYQATGMKQWYLLSVFLGDVIRDVSVCKHLAKRLDCQRTETVKEFVRD